MNKKYFMILALVCSVFILVSCGKKDVEPVRFIKSMVVGFDPSQQRRVFSGISKFEIESNLSFQVSGKVKDVVVDLGDVVKKEDTVALLDDQDYKSNLQAAESEYTQAQRDLERYRKLYEDEHVSRQEFEEVKTNTEVLKSKFDLAKAQLSYTVLRSPVEGKITKVYVNEHEVVSSGQPIVKVEAESALEVEVGVPESFIDKVSPNDKVRVYFETLKEKPFSGTVKRVGSAIDEKTATFPVVIGVATGAQENLRSGMVVDVEFFFSKPGTTTTIMIPLVAILEDQNNDKFVWVYSNEDGKVHKRLIKTGPTQGENIEVVEGLKNGEIIAVAGAHYLKEGQSVKLLDEK